MATVGEIYGRTYTARHYEFMNEAIRLAFESAKVDVEAQSDAIRALDTEIRNLRSYTTQLRKVKDTIDKRPLEAIKLYSQILNSSGRLAYNQANLSVQQARLRLDQQKVGLAAEKIKMKIGVVSNSTSTAVANIIGNNKSAFDILETGKYDAATKDATLDRILKNENDTVRKIRNEEGDVAKAQAASDLATAIIKGSHGGVSKELVNRKVSEATGIHPSEFSPEGLATLKEMQKEGVDNIVKAVGTGDISAMAEIGEMFKDTLPAAKALADSLLANAVAPEKAGVEAELNANMEKLRRLEREREAAGTPRIDMKEVLAQAGEFYLPSRVRTPKELLMGRKGAEKVAKSEVAKLKEIKKTKQTADFINSMTDKEKVIYAAAAKGQAFSQFSDEVRAKKGYPTSTVYMNIGKGTVADDKLTPAMQLYQAIKNNNLDKSELLNKAVEMSGGDVAKRDRILQEYFTLYSDEQKNYQPYRPRPKPHEKVEIPYQDEPESPTSNFKSIE